MAQFHGTVFGLFGSCSLYMIQVLFLYAIGHLKIWLITVQRLGVTLTNERKN
jgi:hypothetical protein